MRIAGVMAGREMPPKHVHQASDINEKLLHDGGATLPW